MLHSTPCLGSKGLPNNPRLRSRSAVWSRDYIPSRPANHPERSRTPPLPEPRFFRENKRRPRGHLTHKSDDSTSSTTSSLFEQMKLDSGYASSRTSREEEYKNSHSTLRPSRKPVAEGNLYQSQDTTGTGKAIWNRVATAASNLTVNISQAWATNLLAFAGEETPPGQESRLTRAMKAYHLEKARNPTDLPSWLFDESERYRRSESYSVPSRDNNDIRQCPQPMNKMPKSRGLRDVYDVHRPDTLNPISIPFQRLSKDDDSRPPSNAADRLKGLRDAKRATANSTRPLPEAGQPKNNEFDAASKAAVTQRPRVGLPPGPRRVRKATDVTIKDLSEDDR
ncbi:hypothetical protein C0995_001972 [Termitomyces sp. Mi166|nr:hypothetical protein C0995_001972 [Termitomyces sp. Mi166\